MSSYRLVSSDSHVIEPIDLWEKRIEARFKDRAPRVVMEGDYDQWYRGDWNHDSPVLLVDTGPLDAWVTSVARGARSSRLNFLSATICVDLAELLLRDGRPNVPEGGGARILIVCPYQLHARFLEISLDHQG